MADNTSIKISLEFDSVSIAQSKLDSLIKRLQENTKLNIDINEGTFKTLERQLDGLKSKIQSTANAKIDGNNINQATVNINKNTDAINKNSDAIKRNHGHMGSWTDRVKNAAIAVTAFGTITTIIYSTVNAIEEGIKSIVDLDNAMVGLRKVTDETEETYQTFMNTANKMAISVGHSTKAAIDATAEFAKLGYSLADAKKLAEQALIYSNIGDIGIDDAVSNMTSTLKGFNLEVENTQHVIDAANEVGNRFAIDSGGIGEALKRSSSSLFEANNSLEESIGLITAANTTIQNPERVGNALKTVSMRLRGIKDDAGELVPKLNETVEALTGITVMKDENTFKSTFQILEEISAVWDDLTDTQRATLTELMFGKQHGAVGSGLLNNFDIALKSAEVAINSTGSAASEQAKYMESISARLNALREEMVGFWNETISSDFVKGTVDALTLLVQTFGDIPSVLATVTSAFLLFKGTAITSSVQSLIAYQMALGATTTSSALLAGATTSLAAAFNTLKLAVVSNPIGAVVVGLTTLVAVLKLAESSQEDYNEAVEESDRTTQSNINQIKQYKAEYEQLANKTNLTKEEKLKLLEVEHQLKTKFGDTAKSIDLQNGSLQKNIEIMDQLAKQEAERFMTLNQRNYEQAKRTLENPYTLTIGSGSTAIGENFGSIEEAIKSMEVGLKNSSGMSDSTFNAMKKQLEDLYKTYDDSKNVVSKYEGYQKSLNGTINDGTDVLNKNTEAQKNNADSIKNSNDKAATSTKTMAEFQADFAKELQQSANDIKEINSALDQHAKSGEWNYDTLLKISQQYPELLGLLNSEEALEKRLVEIKEEKAKASVDSVKKQMDAEVSLISGVAQGYGVDVSNFQGKEEAKIKILRDAINKRISILQAEANAFAETHRVAAQHASEILKVDPEFMNGMGMSSAYGIKMGEIANAKLDLAKVDASLSNYYKLQTMSGALGNFTKNIGGSGYDGKGNAQKDAEDAARAAEQAQQEAYQVVDEINDKLIDAIKLQVEEEKKALDERLDNYKEFIDQKLKALDDEFTKEDRMRKLDEENKKKAELEAQRNELLIDNSDEANARRNDIQKQIDAQQQTIDDLNRDYSREDRKQNLQDQMDAYEKAINEQKEMIDKKYSDEEVAKLANNGLKTGLVQIGNTTISAKQLLLDAMKSSGEAFESTGKKLQAELIDRLEKAKQLANSMNSDGTISSGTAVNILGSHADGAKINKTGLYQLHADEWVINRTQGNILDALVKGNLNFLNNFRFTQMPSFQPVASGTGGVNVTFGSLIGSVQGNVDDGVWAKMKDFVKVEIPKIVADAQMNNDKKLGSYSPRVR